MLRQSFFCFGLILAMTAATGAVDAAVITVGSTGDYSSINAAVQAVPSGATTEIRVAVGTYVAQVTLGSSFSSGSLVLSGGWDDLFTTRTSDPSETVLTSPVSWATLTLEPSGGTVQVSGITVTTTSPDAGHGIVVEPNGTGTARLVITNCVVSGVAVTATYNSYGAGLYAVLNGSEALEITDVVLRENSLYQTTDQAARGGGAYVSGSDDSTILIDGLQVTANSVTTTGNAPYSGGLHLVIGGNVVAQLTGVEVSGNTLSRPDGTTMGTGAVLSTWDSSVLSVRSSTFSGNSVLSGTPAQEVRAAAYGSSRIDLTDSGVAFGDGAGVWATTADTSQLHLTNLTVIDNLGIGIRTNVDAGSQLSLYNTIVYGNGTETSLGGGDTGNNLIGVDPLFADPLNEDFHLGTGSPAENAGTNSPLGGLGTTDLGGRQRIIDGVVDIGCFEGVGVIFADGFASGGSSRWSSIVGGS